MKLTIIKLSQPIYMGDFESISVPATEGDIEILPGHAPYMTSLKEGEIRYRVDGEDKKVEIKKGFLEINKLEVLVIL
jgi:F-type H+-transporting ATPase subunit epsilon